MLTMKKNDLTKPLIVWSGIFTALFVLLLIISIVITQNSFLYYTVCSMLGGSETYLKSGDPSAYQYYTSDYGSKDEVLAAANGLNERICEEGFVLLKNEDAALPLSSGKISVFGKNSVDLVLGGSGSNAGASSDEVADLYGSLEAVGLQCNPTLKAYYESGQSGSGRPDVPAMGDVVTGFPIAEAPLPYPQNVRSSYAEYSDAALVVLSRIGGEGYDLPRTMFWNGSSYTDWNSSTPIPGARSADDHYLQLDRNETDMLEEACSNFKKVVVVINSASPIELGFLDDPSHYAYHENIKAAVWIGDPGNLGVMALGRVLVGKTNPSGRTVDTYARNFKDDPTFQNFGNYLSENGNRYTYKGKTSDAYFVEYREGIYFGYRYYETRAKEAGGDWYTENVVYPFGYGLSYTSFVQEAENGNAPALSAGGTLSFDVTVKNTGGMAGKDVVQLWYSAPYDGGIEKPHIVLGDFRKTALIPSGGEDTVTLTLDVRSMASYDYADANGNGFRGYELEAGEYTVYIGNGSHCWAESDVISFTFSLGEDVRYETDAATGTKIENLFDDVSGQIAEYLSRKNNFENYNVLYGASDGREASEAIVNGVNYKLNDKESDPWYAAEAPTQSQKELRRDDTQVKLADLIGKDLSDPLWEQLMDQLTVGQMVTLISTGNFRTLALDGIDKPLTTDADGPMGYALFMGDSAVYDTCYYASETVLGSSWNRELAEEMGRMIGNEGLVGNEDGDGRPYSGWYAPAVNLHRSQFGGRNFEYYSEDGLLSGILAENVIKGARSKGVYTFVKHFALNEQETKRDKTGLITWTNEQAMREIYFVPFELSVKVGGTTGVMSSFNRIGTTWTGGSYALLTELLRNEWGFEGTVITDFNLKSYMDTDQMIRAGGDLNLSAGKSPTSVTTPTDISCIRRAAKNILYTVANSCAMNGYGADVVWGYTTPVWVVWIIVADCIIFAAAAALSAVTVVKIVKKHKKEQKEDES